MRTIAQDMSLTGDRVSLETPGAMTQAHVQALLGGRDQLVISRSRLVASQALLVFLSMTR